jgi:hypothetical protein
MQRKREILDHRDTSADGAYLGWAGYPGLSARPGISTLSGQGPVATAIITVSSLAGHSQHRFLQIAVQPGMLVRHDPPHRTFYH